jgi:hypothetical protein
MTTKENGLVAGCKRLLSSLAEFFTLSRCNEPGCGMGSCSTCDVTSCERHPNYKGAEHG